MPREVKQLYKFGRFELDPAQRLLLRDGRMVQLTPKAIDLLLVLVESHGRVISKEDLLQRVWPDSFVEEANLSHNIYKLREALSGDSGDLQFIETLARRGYRFVAHVEEIHPDAGELIVEEHSRAHIVIEEETADAALPADLQIELPAHSGLRKNRSTKMVVGGVLLLALAAAIVLFRHGSFADHSGVAHKQIRSIAVLPFKPLAVEGRDETLELGMADTLIMRLSSMQQVTVRPLSAVRKYMSLDQDAMEAGRQLQVEAVLEGSMQKSGDRVRVTARLLQLSDGTQLWADTFDQKLTDVFTLQDSIAERVAAKISQKLPDGPSSSRKGTRNAEAYLLYTRGRYYWSSFSPPQVGASINFFKAAIEKDPNYALAYAGLADAYSVSGIYELLTVQEAYPLAKEAAQHALQLDESLADAHQALGAVKLLNDWDWPGADAELRRAIELDPNNAGARQLHAYYWEAMGRPEEAVREMQRAMEIDPGWMISNNGLTIALNYAGRYDDALKQAEHCMNLDPASPNPIIQSGYSYLWQHHFDDAIAAFQRAIKITPANKNARGAYSLGGLAYAHAVSGHRAEALEELAEMEKQLDKNIHMSMNIAGVYAGLGDNDRALAMLERAYQRRYPRIWHLKLDQRYASLHSDPRFKDLLRRVGMPE